MTPAEVSRKKSQRIAKIMYGVSRHNQSHYKKFTPEKAAERRKLNTMWGQGQSDYKADKAEYKQRLISQSKVKDRKYLSNMSFISQALNRSYINFGFNKFNYSVYTDFETANKEEQITKLLSVNQAHVISDKGASFGLNLNSWSRLEDVTVPELLKYKPKLLKLVVDFDNYKRNRGKDLIDLLLESKQAKLYKVVLISEKVEEATDFVNKYIK